jgi:hypothetical protein
MSIVASHALSTEQLLAIQNAIYANIQLHTSELHLIREKPCSLVEKWQELLQVILPIQLDALQQTQLNLSKFNEEYSRCALTSTVLRNVNAQKWLYIFAEAFGITEFKEISLQEAQGLITEIAKEMTSEDFLRCIDSVVQPHASLIEKRQAILTVLFPLHLSVMARYGFHGEAGYIQAQRAIMDYYYDPLIAQTAAHAQSIVFKRANLF